MKTLNVSRPLLLAHERFEVRLWVMILFGFSVRIAAGFWSDSSSTRMYEFGVIGTNLVQGRGYSYFALDPATGLVGVDLQHSGVPLPSSFMPPLYTYMVSAAIRLSDVGGLSYGQTIWLIRAFNLALYVFAIWVFARLASKLGSPNVGVWAAAFYALYPALVYQTTQVSASNMYIPLELAVLLLALWASQYQGWSAYVLTGTSLGVLALLRSEAVVLPLLVGIWLYVFSPPDRVKGLVKTGVLLAIGWTIPLLWLVRNTVIHGQLAPTISSTGGYNLWIGNHAGATGSQKGHAVPSSVDAALSRIDAAVNYELVRDQTFRRLALQDVAADPLEAAVRGVKKLAMFVGVDVYDERSLNPIYLASYVFLLLLGALGVRLWILKSDGSRMRRAQSVLLLGYVLSALLVPVFFFVLTRYRLPVEIILLLFAAYWVDGRLLRRPSGEISSSGTQRADND